MTIKVQPQLPLLRVQDLPKSGLVGTVLEVERNTNQKLSKDYVMTLSVPKSDLYPEGKVNFLFRGRGDHPVQIAKISGDATGMEIDDMALIGKKIRFTVVKVGRGAYANTDTLRLEAAK